MLAEPCLLGGMMMTLRNTIHNIKTNMNTILKRTTRRMKRMKRAKMNTVLKTTTRRKKRARTNLKFKTNILPGRYPEEERVAAAKEQTNF